MKAAPFFCVIVFSFALFFVSCSERSEDSPSANSIQSELLTALENLAKDPNVPVNEINKLHQFEYHVARMPLDSSPASIEGALDALGKDRWNCFDVETVLVQRDSKREKMLEFFCKRAPETPLRFVPQSLLGR